MKDKDQERWMVWMVQAQHFAKRENYLDAVARMKLVHGEVAAKLASEANQNRRVKLELLLERVNKQLSDLQSQYAAWTRAIAERRQAKMDHVDEEFARPLPIPAD